MKRISEIDINANVKVIGVAFVALVLFLAVSTLIFWAVGLFEYTESNADAKIIAATISLFGVLATGSITVLGLMLKHSFDCSSLALQKDAEARFRMDTALKAVELMNPQKRDRNSCRYHYHRPGSAQ